MGWSDNPRTASGQNTVRLVTAGVVRVTNLTPGSDAPTLRNGKAMKFPPKDQFPTRSEVLASIPEDCFKKDTAKSLMYAAISTAMTVGCGVLAYLYIPMQVGLALFTTLFRKSNHGSVHVMTASMVRVTTLTPTPPGSECNPTRGLRSGPRGSRMPR